MSGRRRYATVGSARDMREYRSRFIRVNYGHDLNSAIQAFAPANAGQPDLAPMPSVGRADCACARYLVAWICGLRLVVHASAAGEVRHRDVPHARPSGFPGGAV